jgi:PBP1b-binding outer membrane lipoprotein LpoB
MLKKIYLMLLVAIVLPGCASVYTGIESADEKNTYYVTELKQNPFGLFSDLLLCKAESSDEMTCESLD